MAPRNKVEDRDKRYREFMDKFHKLSDRHHRFYMGLFESESEQVIKAAIHEFGAPAKNIPARRWMSRFADENEDDIAEIYKQACEEYLTKGGGVKRVFAKYSKEVILILNWWLSTKPLVPDLKPETYARKDTNVQMIETGAMVDSVSIRYKADKGKGGGDGGGGERPPGPGAVLVPPVGPRPSGDVGGRPKGLNFLKNLKTVFSAITGPELYEGYGFRKRPASKEGTSTTPRFPEGSRRSPVSERGSQGHYPSISRPK